MVIACQALRTPSAVTKSTRWAASSGPADRLLSLTSARAAEMAAALDEILDVVTAGALSPEIGEPLRLNNRPSRVTLALSPLPNTSIPPADCVHDRWWMPA